MPWKESLMADQRMRFVSACLDEQDSMALLCRRFGITRRTGYKWLERFRQEGPSGLIDRSRAPLTHPNQIEREVEKEILSMRTVHPTWGARKLLAALMRRSDQQGREIDWPAASTVVQMLRRAGLVVPRRRRYHGSAATAGVCGVAAATGPNHRWCADFKGWFRTGDGSRCEPLTITDAHSRFLLRCQATSSPMHAVVRGLFEATFREFGMPEAIRTDNGEPFASVGLRGMSRLAVWWIRLGITHERIEPGHPQQNGSHERMHGTLKQETANPPAGSLRAQQARFNAFRTEYNQERPHEGLPAMATPQSLYTASPRPFPDRLPQPLYPSDHVVRYVDINGKFRWKDKKVRLCKPLGEQTIGLQPLELSWPQCEPQMSRYWTVRFGPVELGVLDGEAGQMLSERARRLFLA
jgi:putative transposase